MTDQRASALPSSTVHQPVLIREVIQYLELEPGLAVVDGTVGGGGHSRAIVTRIAPNGVLLGLDRDPMMLELARQRIPSDSASLHLIQASYADLPQVLAQLDMPSVDRILVDLGLSSDQLADRDRGFGFRIGGDLDLRFDTSQGVSAAEYLAKCSLDELRTILEEYGEERFADRIAAALVESRRSTPIRTAEQLAELVEQSVPPGARQAARKHPATRVFQALRITVNQEFEHLKRALQTSFPASLSSGGRLAVITFHSLEDRIVKDSFRDQDRWKIVTSKPVTPTSTEQKINPRSRTAKLRVVIRR